MNRRQVFAAGVVGVTVAAVANVQAQDGAKDNPELDKIKADIISGAIMIESKAQPK